MALLSILDDEGNIELGIFSDPTFNNSLILYIDNEIQDVDLSSISNLNWEDENTFNLISIVSDNTTIKVFINDSEITNNLAAKTVECTYTEAIAAGCACADGTDASSGTDSASCALVSCNDGSDPQWVTDSSIHTCLNAANVACTDSQGNAWDGIDESSCDALDVAILDVTGLDLIIGAKANNSFSILDNFWHGYIDEVRLWKAPLTDSVIKYHYDNPSILSDKINNDYIESLIGIWRFNFEGENLTSTILDESNNNNDCTIYTIDNAKVQLSTKSAD